MPSVVSGSAGAVVSYAVAVIIPFVWSSVLLWSKSNQWYWMVILPSGLLLILFVWQRVTRRQSGPELTAEASQKWLRPPRKVKATLGASGLLLCGIFVYDVASPLPGSLSVFGASKPIVVVGVNASSGENFIIDALKARLKDVEKLVWVGSASQVPGIEGICAKKSDWTTLPLQWTVSQDGGAEYAQGTLRDCDDDDNTWDEITLVPPDETDGDTDARYRFIQRAEFLIRASVWHEIMEAGGKEAVDLYLPTSNSEKLELLNEELELGTHSALDELRELSTVLHALIRMQAVYRLRIEDPVEHLATARNSIEALREELSDKKMLRYLPGDMVSALDALHSQLGAAQQMLDKLSSFNLSDAEGPEIFFTRVLSEVREFNAELGPYAATMDSRLLYMLIEISRDFPAYGAQAKEAIEYILDDYDAGSDVWLSYATNEFYDGSPEIAKAYLARILEQNPDNFAALALQYSILLMELADSPGNLEQIIETKTHMLDIDPDHAVSYLDRSLAYEWADNCEGAKRDLDSAAELACTAFAGADCIRVRMRRLDFLSGEEKLSAGSELLSSFKQFANDLEEIDAEVLQKFPWFSLAERIVDMASWPDPLPGELQAFLDVVDTVNEQIPQRFRDAIVAANVILRAREGDSRASAQCKSISDEPIKTMCVDRSSDPKNWEAWDKPLMSICSDARHKH